MPAGASFSDFGSVLTDLPNRLGDHRALSAEQSALLVEAMNRAQHFQDEVFAAGPVIPLHAVLHGGNLKSRRGVSTSSTDGDSRITARLADGEDDVVLEGTGNGPIAAFCHALAAHDVDVRVLDYNEHALSAGGDAKAASYLECVVDGRLLWGVGVSSSIVTASLRAVISAANRAVRG